MQRMFILNKITSFVFQARCFLCDAKLASSSLLCSACTHTLPHASPGCKCCALPLPAHHSVILCGACLVTPPAFDVTYALFDYKDPISAFIHKLKFQGDLAMARLFSEYWITFIQAHYTPNTLPDCIIPVPLHPNRLKERGFNQALEIAKPIGKHFNIPVDTRICVRLKNTKAQSTLTAQQRIANTRHAFGLSYTCSAKHVAILDDVMTTGNTTSEISALLKKTGVEKIDIWCCARAQ